MNKIILLQNLESLKLNWEAEDELKILKDSPVWSADVFSELQALFYYADQESCAKLISLFLAEGEPLNSKNNHAASAIISRLAKEPEIIDILDFVHTQKLFDFYCAMAKDQGFPEPITAVSFIKPITKIVEHMSHYKNQHKKSRQRRYS